MNKVLKLQITNQVDGSFNIQIIEQSHRNREFGPNNTNNFRAKNGFNIISNNNPALHMGEFYVRGNHGYSDNSIIKTTDINILKLLLEAVAEYNNFEEKPPDKLEAILDRFGCHKEAVKELIKYMTDKTN